MPYRLSLSTELNKKVWNIQFLTVLSEGNVQNFNLVSSIFNVFLYTQDDYHGQTSHSFALIKFMHIILLINITHLFSPLDCEISYQRAVIVVLYS